MSLLPECPVCHGLIGWKPNPKLSSACSCAAVAELEAVAECERVLALRAAVEMKRRAA